MLISKILQDNVLTDFLCQECEENGIAVSFCNQIDKKDITIIKVDRYYNKHVVMPDCSPDCLIIQKCQDTKFNIFIVELKNINSPKHFTVSEIVEKFITCLDDFMSKRFAHYFHSEEIEIRNIKLLFIADPYDFKGKPDRQLYDRGLKVDILMSQRIPKYFNKHLYIEYKIPNPTIKKC